jgi:FKBP-type peptidyl-prolyl cis-trans isomerase FkpA
MNLRHAPCALLAALLAVAVPASAVTAARSVRVARQEEKAPAPSGAVNGAKEVVTPSGLRYTDLKVGQGTEAQKGKTVDVLYTGRLEDGTQFDTSQDPNRPFTFRIGIDEVIRGWHEGITGMKVGGKRRLVIPPELGYGKQGAGGGVIPANATLVFEVELLNVR